MRRGKRAGARHALHRGPGLPRLSPAQWDKLWAGCLLFFLGSILVSVVVGMLIDLWRH